MIKQYNNFNEGVNQYLKGPSREEMMDKLKQNPNKLLKISIDNKDLILLKFAIDNGAIIDQYYNSENDIILDDNVSDVQRLNKYPVIKLYEGIWNNDFYLIRRAISEGFKINDGYNNLIITYYISVNKEKSKIEIIEYLLDNNAKVGDDDGSTFYIALDYKLYNIIDLLTKRGLKLYGEYDESVFNYYLTDNKPIDYKLIEIILNIKKTNDCISEKDYNAIDFGIKKNDKKLLILFLKYGFRMNDKLFKYILSLKLNKEEEEYILNFNNKMIDILKNNL